MTFKTQLRRLGEELGDLLERHEKAADLQDFETYADDPLGFVTEVLDGEPWSAQEEIARAVQAHPLTVVRSCNAAGKDWIAAHLALWWVYARRGLVLLTGPTERQVREIVMGEVGRAWSVASDLPGELYTNSLRLGREEQAGILAFTSTQASRLTGFHAPRVFAVLTEAQGVEDFAWEGLLACATGEEDRMLAVGNPLSPSGKFFSVSRSDNWHRIQVSAEEHPNVREEEEIIPGGVSPAFIERIAQEYGRGSGVYRARVEGEFPDTGDEGLFSRSWLEAAADRWEAGEFRKEAEDAEPIVAVDPARYGPDSTVLVLRRGPRLERIESWGRSSTTETVEKICGHLEAWGIRPRFFGPHPGRGRTGISKAERRRRRKKKWRPGYGDVVVDTVGLGGGIHDQLEEEKFETSAFNGGRSPRRVSRKRRFLNQRADAYWELREKLEADEIALPRDPKLFDELVAVRWKPSSTGKVQIESKDDLKGRLGRSPDRADAVSMVFYSRSVRGRGLRNLEPLKW